MLRRRPPNGVCRRPRRCLVPVEDPRRHPDPSDLNGGLARSHSLPRMAIPPGTTVSRPRDPPPRVQANSPPAFASVRGFVRHFLGTSSVAVPRSIPGTAPIASLMSPARGCGSRPSTPHGDVRGPWLCHASRSGEIIGSGRVLRAGQSARGTPSLQRWPVVTRQFARPRWAGDPRLCPPTQEVPSRGNAPALSSLITAGRDATLRMRLRHLSGSAERDILPDDRGTATLASWLTESGPDSPAGR